MDPFVIQNEKSFPEPFRPCVASGFLYKPLLVWDLHTLAGAVFSSILSNDVTNLPSSEEFCEISRVLLVGRMIQAISTPYGIDLSQAVEEDDDPCWNEHEIATEGASLGQLIAYCRAMITGKSLQSLGNLGTRVDVPSSQLLSIVGEAILPFARSLVLILRASLAVVSRRRSTNKTGKNQDSTATKLLESLVYGPDIMTNEDGFLMLKALGGPYPSALVDESGLWKPLIDRWLISAIGFELHHGSMGKSTLSTTCAVSQTWINQPPHVAAPEDVDMQRSLSQVDMDVDKDPVVINASDHGFTLNRRVLMDEDLNDSDEELDDVDDAEEIVDFAGQMMIHPVPAIANAGASSDSVESEDNSSSGSEGDAFESDREFAHVSRSPILPYQPCTLAIEDIGPGRQGTLFEFASASAVMADLSHLGLVHRRFVPTFSFIRLPKSFVELYNMVNKVKGRDDLHSEESDDVGNAETAICLLTGTVMPSGSSRRQGGYSRSLRPPGNCTLHARKHGSGIGVFFLVQKCTVLLMHNNKSAYSASIYVDEHGEEDPGLRRGRPLFLNQSRFQALELLWRQQGIPREVAQIRSTSDRVIRDNWY
jgi:hypothetical protein